MVNQAFLTARECLVDGLDQGGHGSVGTLGHLSVLDDSEVGLDQVQLWAVGWEVVQVDALPTQSRAGVLDDVADVDRGVVEHDDQRAFALGSHSPWSRDRLQDSEHVLGS